MRAASAIVFASAVLAASATAATLDVKSTEPTTTSVLPSSSGISSNATSNDDKIGVEDDNVCILMKGAKWDDFKYACSWYHKNKPRYPYNLFYMRWDGAVAHECKCYDGLDTYKPWGSRWTHSSADNVECYSRDGKTAWDIKPFFDAYNCYK